MANFKYENRKEDVQEEPFTKTRPFKYIEKNENFQIKNFDIFFIYFIFLLKT